MKQAVFSHFRKVGKKYYLTFESYNPAYVWEKFANEMIAKKLSKCTYINSIRMINLYNGFIKVSVYYDNGDKGEYLLRTNC